MHTLVASSSRAVSKATSGRVWNGRFFATTATCRSRSFIVVGHGKKQEPSFRRSVPSSDSSLGRQRLFSTSRESEEENILNSDRKIESIETQKKQSLRDAIRRLKNENGNPESAAATATENNNENGDLSTEKKSEWLQTVSDVYRSFSSSVSRAWEDLLDSSRPKDINKHISTAKGKVDTEAADKYEGTTAIMIIEDSENLNAFERIQKRLSEAPIISDILNKTQEIYVKSGAQSAQQKLNHIAEDAKEAWETSQNPWVYRISSVYDTFTAESEFGRTERELRILDHDFSLEKWRHDVVEATLPKLMQLFLEGNIVELKPWLGEAVYNRMSAEARARKKEGIVVDTNILSIMNSEVLSCHPDTNNGGSPLIVLHFMCQQINCVRKVEGGEIVEGSEDDIRAYSYVAAFQREYNEEEGTLNWKIVDFMLNGAIAYL